MSTYWAVGQQAATARVHKVVQDTQQSSSTAFPYSMLRVKLPGHGVASAACTPAATAGPATGGEVPLSTRRVLSTTGDYSDIAGWLDQQVGKRQGQQGRLVSACSHSNLDLLEPEIESPVSSTSSRSSDDVVATTLPAPAFQLLGLL